MTKDTTRSVTNEELQMKFDKMMRYLTEMPGSAKRVLYIHFLIRALAARASEELTNVLETREKL